MTRTPEPEHYGGNGDAETVQTTSYLLAERELKIIVRRSLLGAFYGPAGVGKTFALRSIICELEGVRPVWVEFESRPTLLHVATVLCRALFGEEPVGNRNRLSLAILEALGAPRGSCS